MDTLNKDAKRIEYRRIFCPDCRKEQPHETATWVHQDRCETTCRICKHHEEITGFGAARSTK